MSRATPARLRVPAGSTGCPGGLGPGSEGLRGRLTVPWESGPCPRARGVNQLSRDTRAWVRRPSGSTSCPRRLRLGSECLWCRPAVPWELGAIPEGLRSPPVVQGDSDRTRGPGCQRAVLGDPRVCPGTRGQPAIPGDLGWSPMSRGVDQLSRATRALFGGTALSTSCPGRLGPRPEGPLCPPAVPCDTGPGPKARGSTSSPWRMAL